MYNKVRETFLHISFTITIKMAEIIWSMRVLPLKLLASLTSNLTKGKEKIGREKVEDDEKDWLPDCGSPYATLTWMFSNSFLGCLSFLLSWYPALLGIGGFPEAGCFVVYFTSFVKRCSRQTSLWKNWEFLAIGMVESLALAANWIGRVWQNARRLSHLSHLFLSGSQS